MSLDDTSSPSLEVKKSAAVSILDYSILTWLLRLFVATIGEFIKAEIFISIFCGVRLRDLSTTTSPWIICGSF